MEVEREVFGSSNMKSEQTIQGQKCVVVDGSERAV